MTESDLQNDRAPAPVEIPATALSPELLNSVVESFILREGTDYGAIEAGLGAKVKKVLSQIESGEVVIVFDGSSETVTLLPRSEWRRRPAAAE